MIQNPTSISDQILNLAEGIGTEMKTLKDTFGTLTVATGDDATVENAISYAISQAVASVYVLKGTKATYSELPSTDNSVGDVWNVTAANGNTPAGTNYVWTGTEWDALGGTIDLSNYVTSSDLTTTLSGYVPTSRTVNSKALSSNITLTASDVSAVPTTRTVNSKALSSDITLTASDLATISPDPYSTFNTAYTNTGS